MYSAGNTYSFSSVSLFASGTDWTRCTGGSRSARSTSGASITTLTLQHTQLVCKFNKGLTMSTGFFLKVDQTSYFNVRDLNYLNPSRTISARRSIRSWVTL